MQFSQNINEANRVVGHISSFTDEIIAVGDESFASICYSSCAVRIGNIETKVSDTDSLGHNNRVKCLVAISEKLFASGSEDLTIKIWDIHSRRCLKTLEGHMDAVLCLAKISPILLASGSRDKCIKIWDIASGKCLKTLEGHKEAVSLLSRISDKHLASSAKKNIKIWDLASGNCVMKLKGHTKSIFSFCRINDELLASSSIDKTIKVWNRYTGDCVKTIVTDPYLARSLDLHCDTTLICSVQNLQTQSHDIRLWNIRTGECKTLGGHKDWTHAFAKRPDGSFLSGGRDGTIRLWSVEDAQVAVGQWDNHPVLLQDIDASGSVKVFGSSIVAQGIRATGDIVFSAGSTEKRSASDARAIAHKVEVVKAQMPPSYDASCVICLERPRQVTIGDCGHYAYCIDCIRTIQKCSICRGPITKTIKIFHS